MDDRDGVFCSVRSYWLDALTRCWMVPNKITLREEKETVRYKLKIDEHTNTDCIKNTYKIDGH